MSTMNLSYLSSIRLGAVRRRYLDREEMANGKSQVTHRPVLLQEVLEVLHPQPHGLIVDATIGLGGHAEAILRASHPNGRLLGLDQDGDALNRAAERLIPFRGRYQLVHSNFAHLEKIASQRQIKYVDGILFDLGVSSLQLDTAERGFSFRQDGPLDMRMDQEHTVTADEIVNFYSEKDLADVIFQFGEEPFSRRIARAIVRSRPHHSTLRLADLIAKVVPSKRARRIHPATKTFQALRIFVNDELGRLTVALKTAIDLLKPGGRIVVISFHSLEDRVVKEAFRSHSRDCVCPATQLVCECGNRRILKLLTRKPVLPGPLEAKDNPRARSAKLRAAERL
ncbi:MAG TPA: 16S rRNA (cytosine(1402)-N(4))-methyltransferase RsmH [Terriglobia bacterium]|nr:16S rRNA (cytosine(1402)-N(4))-methyltransferase RsmH [Terriglobia bacterium]